MRYLALLLLLHPASAVAQRLSYEEWLLKAMADKRLEPCYGAQEKTPAQKESDADFIALALRGDTVRRSVSDKLVDHGTTLLKEGNHTQAMMRFNQAWLVDSTNARPFWGFGTFFMELDRPAVAVRWYKRGLARDSAHVRLLDGLATALLAERHSTMETETERRNDLLSAALSLLERAQAEAPKDGPVAYRLAVCHLLRGDCAEAKRCAERCAALPSCPMEQGFQESLLKHCP